MAGLAHPLDPPVRGELYMPAVTAQAHLSVHFLQSSSWVILVNIFVSSVNSSIIH